MCRQVLSSDFVRVCSSVYLPRNFHQSQQIEEVYVVVEMQVTTRWCSIVEEILSVNRHTIECILGIALYEVVI